jgi:hypothetical protein
MANIAWLRSPAESYASTPPKFPAAVLVAVAAGMVALGTLDRRLCRGRSGLLMHRDYGGSGIEQVTLREVVPT